MEVNAQTPASYQTFTDHADPYIESERLRGELAQTRQMLADAQRLTKTGSWIIDPIGGGAWGSPECYRILGHPGKTSSKHYMECLSNVHPDDLPAVLEEFQASVATGEARPIHYRIVAGDGSITDVETVAQPVPDETGRVVSLVGTVMDVTERNRVQEALRASEKLARGQLGALTRTLDALVQEASPDRLLEVVLRTIAQQFDASSVAVRRNATENQRAELAFLFVGDGSSDADDALFPPAHASPELVVPMLIAGEVAGEIAIGFRDKRELQPDEIELAQALANQAMLALQLTRLSDQSRQAAVMAERDRVVRDVHDTLAHAFTGVIVQLEASDDASARGFAAEAGAHIARAEAMARAGLQEARRSVMALRPQALEGNDLSAALRELVTRMTDGTSVVSEFAQRGAARRLPPGWDEHLLRIGQEALTNAIRHGRARRIAMQLDFADEAVHLRLADDGRGFDTDAAFDGFGLAGIRARALSIGGQLSIRSAVGAGTTISVSVPQATATAL